MVPSEQDRPDKVSLTLGGRPVSDQNQPAQQANQLPELLSYNNPLKSQLPIETITKPKIEKPINPSTAVLLRRRSSLWSAPPSAVRRPTIN